MFKRFMPAVGTRTTVSKDIMSDETTNMERVRIEVGGGKTFVERKKKKSMGIAASVFKNTAGDGEETRSLVTWARTKLRQPPMLSFGFLALKWQVNTRGK